MHPCQGQPLWITSFSTYGALRNTTAISSAFAGSVPQHHDYHYHLHHHQQPLLQATDSSIRRHGRRTSAAPAMGA